MPSSWSAGGHVEKEKTTYTDELDDCCDQVQTDHAGLSSSCGDAKRRSCIDAAGSTLRRRNPNLN